MLEGSLKAIQPAPQPFVSQKNLGKLRKSVKEGRENMSDEERVVIKTEGRRCEEGLEGERRRRDLHMCGSW